MTITLSVVIPTRNRSDFVAELLESLAGQFKVGFDWEVIVVDNGSIDQTAKIVNQKSNSLPIHIRYVFEPKLGLHNGRHRGLQDAEGDFIAFLDDDILVTQNWIHGIDKIISGDADAVVGRILPKWERTPPGWLSTLVKESGFSGYLSVMDLGSSAKQIDPVYVYGDNFFTKANIVKELGGFNPDSLPENQLRYRGDGEYGLMLKFKKAGLRAWYEPGATVFHRVPVYRMNMRYLCKRSYAQGISDSYSKIRAEIKDPTLLPDDFFSTVHAPRKSIQYYRERVSKITWVKTWTRLSNGVLRWVPFTQPNIKERLRQAWWSGYQYHQMELKTDPKLMEWISRDNYWDAQPE